MKTLSFILLALAITTIVADTHVVIVAGSNGFWNYRHQTDACHAYQIAVTGGIPAANIILFSYDDVASSSQNPFPGKLYNRPSGAGHGDVDVYSGCVIDYSRADVTPTNYLAVLQGNAAAVAGKGTGRVLTSTADDNVFLNFADHGAVGLIAFPSSYLYSKDLLDALTNMHTKKMYKQLVYYLEACESGSMFEHLPNDLSIYAVTAANASESSWGFYCPPDDIIGGVHVGSCLGDLFSINWMEDADAADSTTETLAAQFTEVKTKTTKSHVMEYGDVSFKTEFTSAFLGVHNKAMKIVAAGEEKVDLSKAISSRDIKLHYLINRHATHMNENTMAELTEEITSRKNFDDIFTEIRKLHADIPTARDTDYDCYKNMINHFELTCGKFSEYGMKYMRSFFDMCANKQDSLDSAKDVLIDFCGASQLF